MSGGRVGGRRLSDLADELTGKQRAVIAQVAELKLMSTRQIEALHYTAAEHRSAIAASRACRRFLERCARERILVRLERRIGGIRSGSASFIYAIGPVGERLLQRTAPRYRYREPAVGFIRHTLVIGDLIVGLTVASRRDELEIIRLQTEPTCWRSWTMAGGATGQFRPDLFVRLGVEDLEYDWFVEIDLGTEHLPTLMRKSMAAETYYRSGREQATGEVFPRVVWLMHSPERAKRLRTAIDAEPGLTNELFVITTIDKAITTLKGGTA